jgi:multidrug resistance efflux pump
MKKSKTVYLVWAGSLICVVLMTIQYQAKSARFFGIAETQEQTVSFQHPVELKKIHVVTGQLIRKDDLIVEVVRPDLVAQMAIIAHKIEELAAKKLLIKAKTTTELESLRAERDSKMVEFDYQIQELKNLYRLNQRLVTKSSGADRMPIPSPIRTKIEGLQKRKQFVEKSLQARIDNIQDQLARYDSPLEAQTEKLKTELKALSMEKAELVFYASSDGIVGSVFFGVGEEIASFEPILTLHPKTPSYVIGYIHEDVTNHIRVKQNVKIRSLSVKSKHLRLTGVVKSIGARIVEYPERLKRQRGVSIWGREVLISIQQNSGLLLGEKVSIAVDREDSHTSMISAVDGFVNRVFALLHSPIEQG